MESVHSLNTGDKEPMNDTDIVRFARHWEYSFSRQTLSEKRHGGQILDLGKRDVLRQLLEVLLRKRGTTVPRGEIIAEVWPDSTSETRPRTQQRGYDAVNVDLKLNEQIATLKRILGTDAICVQTRRSHGYGILDAAGMLDGKPVVPPEEAAADDEAVMDVVLGWLTHGLVDWFETLPRHPELRHRIRGDWRGWNYIAASAVEQDDPQYGGNEIQDRIEDKAFERFLAICAGVTSLLSRVADVEGRERVRSLLAEGHRHRQGVEASPSDLDPILEDGADTQAARRHRLVVATCKAAEKSVEDIVSLTGEPGPDAAAEVLSMLLVRAGFSAIHMVRSDDPEVARRFVDYVSDHAKKMISVGSDG